jgi:hypothetical protein
MALESHAQAVEDVLHESLSFKLRPSASYVIDRKFVTFWPQGSSEYKVTGGVKVIKININGTDWLDPSSMKLHFIVKNEDTTLGLQPFVNGIHNWFRRLRVIIGGQVVEDIDNYNRVCQMFTTMMDKNKQLNDSIESWTGTSSLEAPQILALSSSAVCLGSLFAGIFNQDKYLPVKYCPITIELELVNTYGDSARAAGSQLWSIEDVQLKCDMVTLDSQLDNSYAEHLLSGKSIPISYTSYTTSQQVCSGDATNVNISRSLTRLKSIFVTLFKEPANRNLRNEVNLFYHRMAGTYNKAQEIQFELQLGSKKWPEYPMLSQAEGFYQLRKTMGILGSAYHSLDFTGREYVDDKFIIGFDLEKMLGASFTGYNSKSGDLLTVKLKNTAMANGADMIYTTLHYDALLEISDTGVTVME